MKKKSSLAVKTTMKMKMIIFMEKIHNILICTTKIFTLESDLIVKSILMKQSLVKSQMTTNM